MVIDIDARHGGGEAWHTLTAGRRAIEVPVVATGAGGIGSVVRHDETGVIVPERDADALAAAIKGLLDDPLRRSRLGAAGRAVVEGRFGWDTAAARFESAYDRALAFKSLTR